MGLAARSGDQGHNQIQTATPTPVVIIAGPTASGKSVLALALAERFGGTIINADSMQVYRDLRILTARPDRAAEAGAPHRLYGYLDAAERGSVARWLALAQTEITSAAAGSSLPIVVGGTGLYLRALVEGLADIPDIPAEIRAEAATLYAQLGGTGFRERLALIDPVSAARLPPQDRQRLTRAWEVVRATGQPIGEWQRDTAATPPYRFATILLMPPRPALYAGCNARLETMVAAGALDEVAALAARNLDPELPAMKALGMPELLAHVQGELPLPQAVAAAQQATRRYAKRQITWFGRQLQADLVFDEPGSPELPARAEAFVRDFLLTRIR